MAQSAAPIPRNLETTSTPAGRAAAGVPRILVIYTGGTIGMVSDPKTGALVPFDFDHLVENVPKLSRLGYDIVNARFDAPIDSSNMDPAHWAKIVRAIAGSYDDFDGFVVLHGTDTMAYTASALSFMLEGLAKPVILTGSQLPIDEIREDGTENLITALQIAAAKDGDGGPVVREVAISFGSALVRGNRSTKASSTEFGAFRSFNYPLLGTMNLHIRFDRESLWRPAGNQRLHPQTDMAAGIETIALHPGITEASLTHQLACPGAKAFVLRTYGAGNAPTKSRLFGALAAAVRRGLVIVNVTQCPNGGVDETRYATGDALAEAGVISGRDITAEAAIAKLMYLFGKGLSPAEVEEAMGRSLVGEMTIPV